MSLTLISIACLTGFIGDALLQIGSKNLHLGGTTGWGLKTYFAQHGAAESTFIAGGMMSLFYVFVMNTMSVTYLNLAICGVILDLIFRKTMLFASLKGYYQYFNYFWSAVWGAIPMIMPLLIYDIIRKML